MQRLTDQRFLAIAQSGDSIGALAAAFFASFGVSLIDIQNAISTMVEGNMVEVGILCIVAGTQIRANTTFVQPKDIQKISVFTISSQRPGIVDQVNFKAVHMAGHALAMLAGANEWAQKMNVRGNCIRGGDFPDNTAGKINREIYDSIAPEEKMSFQAWVTSDAGKKAATWATGCFTTLQNKKVEMAASAPKRPTPKPATGKPAGSDEL